MNRFLTLQKQSMTMIIGDDGVFLLSPSEAGITSTFYAAEGDAEARRRLSEHLAQFPDAKVKILYNGSGQDFRNETLPPLNYFDTEKLIKRRLAQAFPNAYAVASRKLDRQHAVFGAIQQSAGIERWLNALRPDQTVLGLLPIECAELVVRLMPEAKQGWAMLVSKFKTGGCRQIVTRDGQLIFTRLTEDITASVIENTRDYLSRFGLTKDTNLRVVCITDQTKNDFAGIENLKIISSGRAAEICGLASRSHQNDDGCDHLFAAYAGRQRLLLSLSSPVMKRKKQEAVIAYFGQRFAALALVTALGFMFWHLGGLASQLYKNHREATMVDQFRQQLQEAQAAEAPSGQPLGMLLLALERQRIYAEPQPEPWDILQQLGAVLEGKARTASADWNDNGDLKLELGLDNGVSSNTIDHEGTVRNLKELADKLGQSVQGYRVEVTRYPFPAMPQDTLTNASTDNRNAAEAVTAELTLRKQP